MKKKILSITVLFLLMAATAITVGRDKTHSQLDLPYPEAATCQEAWRDQMAWLEDEWSSHLQQLTGQEEAASDMVDDVFESLRTYRCWLEYVCRGVQYSGNHTPEATAATGLMSEHIGTAPGCQPPEDVGLPGGFEAVMENIFTLGLVDRFDERRGEIGEVMYNKFTQLPQCYVDEGSAIAQLQTINGNYANCMNDVERAFAADDSPGASKALVLAEFHLRKAHADQKSRVLESKLASIVGKMHSMEEKAAYLKETFFKLENLYPCIATKCD